MFKFDQKIWKFLLLLSPRPSEAEEFENFLSTSVFAFHVCFYLFSARLFSTSLHPLSFLAIWFAWACMQSQGYACERGRSCSVWTHPYHKHSTLFDTETIVNYSAARCTTTPHRFQLPYTHSRTACCVNAALRYMRDAERVKLKSSFSSESHRKRSTSGAQRSERSRWRQEKVFFAFRFIFNVKLETISRL